MIQRFTKFHNQNTDLFRNGARLWGLVTSFEITEPSHVQISGYANVRHKGAPSSTAIIGVGSRIGYRVAPSLAEFDTLYPQGTAPGSWQHPSFKWISGAKDGQNMISVQHHYATLCLSGDLYLTAPGFYRLEPYLFEQCAAYPNQDGLTCVNTDAGQPITDTYGYMTTIVTPME